MILCSVLSVLLVVVVVIVLYGLGYVPGTVPKMYRNATEGRLTCEDLPRSLSTEKINYQNYEWRLAQTLQGGTQRVFEERIDRKQTECYKNS
jgi:hypothetical protein